MSNSVFPIQWSSPVEKANLLLGKANNIIMYLSVYLFKDKPTRSHEVDFVIENRKD